MSSSPTRAADIHDPAEEGMLMISVADTGAGIAPEVSANSFSHS